MHSTLPIVKTNYGRIQGVVKNTTDGKEYLSFQGIPYAEQPIGEKLRFRDPQPLERPWEGVLDASKEGPVAFNHDVYSVVGALFSGSDECLTLNVYTPCLNPQKPLPVFVWIHGGGFVCGAGTTEYYGPDFIVEKDVIMVSFNYRLGVFGFLSFENEEIGIPGNAGLKDQVMALKWIKENISCFGGDAENITISGESAGAASCHYHMISPLSQGLFNRAILMSASAYNPWAHRIPGNTKNYEAELAKLLGWNGEGGEKEIFNIISKAEPELLAQLAFDRLLSSEEKCFGSAIFAPFLPTVEPYDNGFCFLPKSTLELSRNPWSKNMDIIIGGLSHEGIMFYGNLAHIDTLKTDYSLLVPLELKEKFSSQNILAKGEALKRAYFGDSEPTADNEIFLNYTSEKLFWHGIYRYIIQRIRNGGEGKTFCYWMQGNADPEIEFYRSWRQLCGIPHFKGFNHGDELPLVFKGSYTVKPTHTSCVYNLFQQFLGICMEFTKCGNPNYGEINWTPSEENPDGLQCLDIREESSSMGRLPNWEKIKAWNEVYQHEDLLY